jgi:hypothetical protein
MLLSIYLVLSACSNADHESLNKEFKVEVSDISGEPIEGAYVTLYSDNGQTIVQSLLTDIDGAANFGILERETVSFSLVKLKSAEPQSLFRGVAIYDTPVDTYKINLHFQGDEIAGRNCVETNTVYLYFDESLPQNRIHYISTSSSIDYRYELEQGMPISICKDDLKGGKTDILVTSRNQDNLIDTTFGWAKDVEITEGKDIYIDYGIGARSIRIYSNVEPQNDLVYYHDYEIFRKGKSFQSHEAIYADGYRIALLPDITEEFQLRITTYEMGTFLEHSLLSVINADKDEAILDFSLKKPEVDIDSNNELFWSIEDQEPSYVSSTFMGHNILSDGVTYDLFWSFSTPGKNKQIQFPVLPQALNEFQHTPRDDYPYISFSASYSKSFNNAHEDYLFHLRNYNSDHLPEYSEDHWFIEIE